jgi:hypothetical protein
MFCALKLVLGGIEGVGSHFHVLHSRTRFGRYRGRLVQFSYFTLLYSFLTVPMASGPIFMFCAQGLVLGGTKGVTSHFNVLLPGLIFSSTEGARVPFSCFAFPVSCLAEPMTPGPIFRFCAPVLVFGGTVGAESRFHVLRPRTHFRRYRGRWVPYPCFALMCSFSAVPWGRVLFSSFALPDSFSAVR